MRKSYVQHIIDYVEENIHEVITMDSIINYLGYSRHYTHKLFSIYTGMSVMDYVRRRKLEYSLQDLKSQASILDIAIKYAYNSSRSYARAFQNIYGVSPSHYRNNSCELTPKLILDQLGGIKMLSYLSESKVVNLNTIYALANKAISKECEEDIITYMTNYRLKHKLVDLTEVGFDVPVTEEETEKGLRGYEQWIVLNKEDFDAHSPESPVVKVQVEKSKYLMLTITEPFIDPWERIPNAWKKIWAEVEENYTFKKNFKVYGFEEKVDTLHGTFMNIYVPIE